MSQVVHAQNRQGLLHERRREELRVRRWLHVDQRKAHSPRHAHCEGQQESDGQEAIRTL